LVNTEPNRRRFPRSMSTAIPRMPWLVKNAVRFPDTVKVPVAELNGGAILDVSAS